MTASNLDFELVETRTQSREQPLHINERFDEDLSRLGLHLDKWALLSPAADRDAAVDPPVPATEVRGFEPPPKLISWGDSLVGMFVTDVCHHGGIAINTRASSHLLAFEIAFDCEGERSYRIDNETVQLSGLILSVISMAKGSKFDLSTRANRFRTLSIVIDTEEFQRSSRFNFNDLPREIRTAVGSGQATLRRTRISAPIRTVAGDILTHQHRGPLSDLYYEGKCRELLALLVEHFIQAEQMASIPVSTRDFQRIEEIHRLVSENPVAAVRVDNLARVAAMNRTKLRSLFKQVYGVTISEYRTLMLMQRADQLLRDTDLSVLKISYMLGYSDASGFIVAYKKFFGHSPGSVRSSRYQ